jgi:hypothetical protein
VPPITTGQIVAFYLFDVAESIDLAAIAALVGRSAVASRLAPKPATPAYVQYENPPVSFDGGAVDVPTLDGFQVRFRAYDYGVISLALSSAVSGPWSELLSIGQTLIENAELEQHAEDVCRQVAARLRAALTDPRTVVLGEDYFVYVVHELERPLSADEIVSTRGGTIAQMLRGERQALSEQEQQTVLQHRISYLADDLVIATWNAAFVYDTPAGAQAALEILEFANSQLLEFRYYDQRLDAELASIYARLQRPRWYEQWIGSHYRRAARQVHSLFIDVNELTDRTENTLKFIGDIYAARLFGMVATRGGRASWKANVKEKLQTLDAIYRFAVEQSSISRGHFLEVAVVLILVLELGLVLAGIMK